jgi:type II secretory pathway component PulK
LAATTGLSARRSRNLIQAAEASARLDEALAAAVLALRRTKQPWATDGHRYRLELPGAEAEIVAQDESGKVSLNQATTLLNALIHRLAGSREEGDRLFSALIMRTSQRPLVSVAEIATLPGMNARLYAQLAPLVTVHSRSELNWRLADRAILAAIPVLSPEQIATLVARRGESGYTPEPAVADLMTQVGIAARADLGATGGTRLVSLRIELTLTSGGRASAETTIRLSGDGAPYHSVEWRAPADWP